MFTRSIPSLPRALVRRDNRSMRWVAAWLFLLFLGVLIAQDKVYVCPMDPDVRANKEGVCSRCGMKLVAGLPDPIEYPLELTITPRKLVPGDKSTLSFVVRDPWKNRPVTNFQVVHEKLF